MDAHLRRHADVAAKPEREIKAAGDAKGITRDRLSRYHEGLVNGFGTAEHAKRDLLIGLFANVAQSDHAVDPALARTNVEDA